MRTLSAAFAGALMLAAASVTSFGRADYDIKKVAPAVINSPVINFTLGPQVAQGKALQWLQVETLAFESNVDWTDELTFKYYILLAGQCLTGEVTHIDIPKARDLYSVMYVSPRTIAKILNGHQLSPLDIQDVGVQILKQGQVLDTQELPRRRARRSGGRIYSSR